MFNYTQAIQFNLDSPASPRISSPQAKILNHKQIEYPCCPFNPNQSVRVCVCVCVCV
jgi:hypothetical protein